VRRLTRTKATNERGAISVIVAILLVTLLGFVAIAVDVGVIYSERAQLQNGADASAIASPRSVQRRDRPGMFDDVHPRHSLANQNALDGMSKVYSIELDKTARKSASQRLQNKPAAQTTLFPSSSPTSWASRAKRWAHVRLLNGAARRPAERHSPSPSPSARSRTTWTARSSSSKTTATMPTRTATMARPGQRWREASAGWHLTREMRRHHRPCLERGRQ
jgi:Flp pilus assembly protein TadG